MGHSRYSAARPGLPHSAGTPAAASGHQAVAFRVIPHAHAVLLSGGCGLSGHRSGSCRAICRAAPEIHWKTLLTRLQARLNEWDNPTSELNKLRQQILRACVSAAANPKGIYTLTVPTGGGKTTSSLAFALHHAVEHGMKRVIYVVPYTSIIEQNADVFRGILGDENVLEHHSGVRVRER